MRVKRKLIGELSMSSIVLTIKAVLIETPHLFFLAYHFIVYAPVMKMIMGTVIVKTIPITKAANSDPT